MGGKDGTFSKLTHLYLRSADETYGDPFDFAGVYLIIVHGAPIGIGAHCARGHSKLQRRNKNICDPQQISPVLVQSLHPEAENFERSGGSGSGQKAPRGTETTAKHVLGCVV
jgi:hypothetical protein